MDQLTLGEISGIVALFAGLITGGGVIAAFFTKKIGAIVVKSLEPTEQKLDKLAGRLEAVDLSNCKNFLVQIIGDLERGKVIDKVTIERFWENYDQYTALGGNSYVHEAVEKLKREGKL